MLDTLRDYLARNRRPPFDTGVCGHRGASATAPENTVSAFVDAIRAGCDLVELDVLITADDQLAVIHDEKLSRTTDGDGRVSRMTLAEIRECDAGCWFTESFAGERVPTLPEALGALQGRATAMIELKQSVTKHTYLVDRLVEDLKKADADERCLVIVWDMETAEAVRRTLPEALLALVVFTRLGVRKAAQQGFDGVVSYWRSTTKKLIDEAHDRGLFVTPWTVNAIADMDFFCRHGADAVITDIPHVLKDRLERLELERTQSFLAASGRNASVGAGGLDPPR